MARDAHIDLSGLRALIASLRDPVFHVVDPQSLKGRPCPRSLAPLLPHTIDFGLDDLERESRSPAVTCMVDALQRSTATVDIRFLGQTHPVRMTVINMTDTEGVVVFAFSESGAHDDPPTTRTAEQISLVLDASGVVTQAAPAAQPTPLGPTGEELAGTSLLSLIHPEDTADALIAFADALAQPGLPRLWRVRLSTAEGWRWFEIYGVVLGDDEDTRVHCTLVDVQNGVEALAAVELGSRRFRALAEAMPLGMFLARANGEILYANRRFIEETGFTPGRGTWDLLIREAERDQMRHQISSLAPLSEMDIQFPFAVLPGKSARTARLLTRPMPPTADDHSEFVAVIEDTTSRRELEARLAYEATHDRLTGLANRGELERHLAALTVSTDTPIAVLFIDIDDFKRINDSFGHTGGDLFLQTLAWRLSGRIRSCDFVGRFGGDEFVLVTQQERGLSGALSLAHDLLRTISEPIDLLGVEVKPRASIGIALGERGNDPERLIGDADAAMYAAKTGEGSPVRVADKKTRRASARRLVIEGEFDEAIEDGGMDFHFQPIVLASDGTLVGAEALLRWKHPDFGWIPPGELVAIAEETGRIEPFTAWGLNRVAAHLAGFRRRHPHHSDVHFGYNLSTQQLSLPEYVDTHLAILEHHGLTPADLVIEVTETTPIESNHPAETTVERLAGAGVPIALDDFGSGYSSLGYLVRFPIRYLKLDRSLTGRLTTDAKARTVAEGVALVCSSLDVTVIAEGVETLEELDVCTQLGFQDLQGYLLGRPHPVDVLATLDNPLVPEALATAATTGPREITPRRIGAAPLLP